MIWFLKIKLTFFSEDLGGSSNILVWNWKTYVEEVFMVTLCDYKLNDFNAYN